MTISPKNKKILRFRLSWKLLILFGFFIVTIGITTLIIFNGLKKADNLLTYTTHKIEEIAAEQCHKVFHSVGQQKIKQRASDIGNQLSLYLMLHPKKTITDLKQDAFFTKIAIQQIGQSGYTAIHDSKGINHFHINPFLVDSDLHDLKDKLPAFWKILEKSLAGESEGFYKWEDSDGQIREKYMYIAPISPTTEDGTELRLAVTIYSDEFFASSLPVQKEFKNNLEQATDSFNALLRNINEGVFLLIFLIIALGCGLFLFIHSYFYSPLRKLSKIAAKVSDGDIKLIAPENSTDEIGELAKSVNNLRHKLMKNNQGLKDKVEEQTEKMKSFVSVTSHQLRTPLTGIKWLLQILKKNPENNLSENQHHLLEQISETNERLIHLVNNLLNVSKLETEGIEVKREINDIQKTVEHVLQDNISLIKTNKITVVNKIKKELMVFVDEEKISQVFHNLISNALKYANKKITIEFKKEKGLIVFTVKDDGMGIPEEQQAKLFQKFFRASNAKAKKIEGSGLGLYIAKMIVEAHKGKIWYESHENDGSAFHFSISLK